MIEGVTLGQLRAFVAAVDEGSFSAAGRRLGKTPSVVTQTIANLERQLGLKLFDRTARKPVIVGHAESLLADARRIVRDVQRLEARARSLVSGLESELSVVVDVMFPAASVTRATGAFAKAFPYTALHLHVEALGAVVEMVIGRRLASGPSTNAKASSSAAMLTGKPARVSACSTAFCIDTRTNGYDLVANYQHPLMGGHLDLSAAYSTIDPVGNISAPAPLKKRHKVLRIFRRIDQTAMQTQTGKVEGQRFFQIVLDGRAEKNSLACDESSYRFHVCRCFHSNEAPDSRIR